MLIKEGDVTVSMVRGKIIFNVIGMVIFGDVRLLSNLVARDTSICSWIINLFQCLIHLFQT